MERPPMFGAWHMVSLTLAVLLAAFMVWKFKDCNDKTLRRVLLVFWVIIVALEAYKQIVFSMNSDGVTATWDYQWYAFPFQFCSSPLFIYPLIVWLRDGMLRNMAIAFTAFFCFFGGLAVMLYPGDVFIDAIGINIQTMLNHGGQVVIGIFCAARYRKALSNRFWLSSLPVFGVLFLIATILNIAAHYLFPLFGIDETFNMFFISPFHDTTLPVLSMFNGLPHIFLSLIYLVSFALISFIMYWLHRGVYLLILRIQKAKTSPYEA